MYPPVFLHTSATEHRKCTYDAVANGTHDVAVSNCEYLVGTMFAHPLESAADVAGRGVVLCLHSGKCVLVLSEGC